MHRVMITAGIVALVFVIGLTAQAGPHQRAAHGGKPSKPATSGRLKHSPKVSHRRASTRRNRGRRVQGAKKVTKISPRLVVKHNGAQKQVRKRVMAKNYHKKYGKKFKFKVNGKYKVAWYYPGRIHRHWKFYCYNTYYKKWLFFDECTSTYYYYCGMCTCYRPIEYVCQVCLETPDDPEVDPCTDEGSGDDEVVEEADCCGNG